MTTKKPTEDSQQDTSSIQERINAQKRKCKALTVTPSPAAARANDSNHGLSTQTDETNKLSTPADEALYQEYKEQLRHKRARAAGIPLAETPPSPAPRPNGKPVPSAGAILRLATGELLVFDRDVPARDYQLVYNLLPDGTASPEGICLLDAYEFEQIGLLSNDVSAPSAEPTAGTATRLCFTSTACVSPSSSQNRRPLAPRPLPEPRPTSRPESPLQPGSHLLTGPGRSRAGSNAVNA